MYESRQAYSGERSSQLKRESDGGNRTGIPLAIQKRYEAASGLSLDDVRVHYNSNKPERMQALAYTQGNQVFMAPGQERYLEHELGHVVQQKLGLVKPAWRMNGLPVNDDPGLERQADRGVIPAGQPVLEGRQDIVQGVFVKWKYGPDGQRYLVETGQGDSERDSKDAEIEEILQFVMYARDEKLVGKLNKEIYDWICEVEDDDGRMRVLNAISSVMDDAKFTMDKLGYDCCNEIWWFAKRMRQKASKDEANTASEVLRLVEGKLSKAGEEENPAENELGESLSGESPEADKFSKIRYPDMKEEIERLEKLIDSAAGETNPQKKTQLKQLTEYAILGLLRLKKRYERDIIMRRMSLRYLQLHFQRVFGQKVKKSEDGVSLIDVDTAGIRPATYAAEKSQQVVLPARGELSGALTNSRSVARTGEAVTTELAKSILLALQQPVSQERLVIYRGMGASEAISILGFFNSPKAAGVEKAVMEGTVAGHINEESYVAPLGKHFGERAQAEGYDRLNAAGGDHANVLLAFVLKPGAKELLFSESLLVLPQLQQEKQSDFWYQMRQRHAGYDTAPASEGAKAGYIGIKPEKVGDKQTYSLGIANQSKLLLQLLIDRVEVKRIIV